MKRVSMSKWRKRITSGVLLIALTLTLVGAVEYPVAAEATDTVIGKIVYESGAEIQAEFKAWKEQTTKSAPVKEGYLFGGWYSAAKDESALTVDNVNDYTDTVYAKFVPAYVLSVKTQVNSNATREGETANLRILTGVDSLQYRRVGVLVSLGNKDTNVKNYYKKSVYDAVKFDSTSKVKADVTFGFAAKYYGVWTVGDIPKVKYDTQIYVRPYWITMDGTTVYGLAKYFHTSDSWNNYITIPINKMPAASDSTAVAAGMVTIKYDSEKVKFIRVDAGEGKDKTKAGRVFGVGKEAYDIVDDEPGTVKIVANGTKVNREQKDETLFTNLIFQLNDATKLYGSVTDDGVLPRGEYGYLNFDVSEAAFCDWDQNMIENHSGVWSIQY